MDLCDNLMLRAIAEEVDRRNDEINGWDPQSLSNMTLGWGWGLGETLRGLLGKLRICIKRDDAKGWFIGGLEFPIESLFASFWQSQLV